MNTFCAECNVSLQLPIDRYAGHSLSPQTTDESPIEKSSHVSVHFTEAPPFSVCPSDGRTFLKAEIPKPIQSKCPSH